MAERGHYSLIQFVPDRGRAEGANVGVVVICPKLSAARVLICEGSEAPKERFGGTVVEEWRVESATAALKHRLLGELSGRPTLETLERVRSLEGNALTLTPARTVAVDDIDRVATKLLDELVRIPERRRERAKAPDVVALVQKLRMRHAPILQPGTVTVPKSGESLKVAFAYQNGALNYVHAQGFGKMKEKVLSAANRLGAQGQLLYKGSCHDKKLVVLARFDVEAYKPTVTDICHELDVRLVDEEAADEFVEEVVRTAHA